MACKGVRFDYFTLDTGWADPGSDLTRFNPLAFPDGPERVIRRVKSLAMKFRPMVRHQLGRGNVLGLSARPRRPATAGDGLSARISEQGRRAVAFLLCRRAVLQHAPQCRSLPHPP